MNFNFGTKITQIIPSLKPINTGLRHRKAQQLGEDWLKDPPLE